MRLLFLFLGISAWLGFTQDPEPTLTYTGKVQLVDEFGQRQADYSGVLVSVSDLSPQVTTETNADGTFSLAGLPDTVHTLVFSKSGYGTYEIGRLKPAAGNSIVLALITLGQVATTRTTLREVQHIATGYIVSGSVSPAPTAVAPRPHRLYLQEVPYYVPLGPVANSYALSLRGHTRPDGTFTDTLTYQQLAAAHLMTYTSMDIYLWATGDNPAATSYRHAETGKPVYPAANLDQNSPPLQFSSQY